MSQIVLGTPAAEQSLTQVLESAGRDEVVILDQNAKVIAFLTPAVREDDELYARVAEHFRENGEELQRRSALPSSGSSLAEVLARLEKLASSVPVMVLPLLAMSCFFIGCDSGAAQRAAVEQTQAQVRRIAEELDKKTTETGVYERIEEDDVQDKDAWGTRLQVSYSQGGVSETLVVRSAGPDKKFQTDDDVIAQGMSMNFKGVGEGIKKNVGEVAANAAKGAVKGTVDGVKESIKEALPFKRKKTDGSSNAEKVEPPDGQPDGDKPSE